MARMGLIERFWSHVDVRGPDECWPWKACRHGQGYGIFKMTTGVWKKAHRVAYFLTHGTWPDAVLHSCDNPPCCNPRHLSAGTQLLNVADRHAKGRDHHPRGRLNPNYKDGRAMQEGLQ